MKRIFASLFVLAAASITITNTARFTADAARKPLAEQATIRRDTFGVPHILAETEEAAAFAMGYAQAEDHCVEIARRFLSARGEEAKYTGAGVETDFESKRYGIHEIARKNFHQLSPLMQQMHHAFAAGFNRYVEKNRKDMPSWIPTFDGVDVLAYGQTSNLQSKHSSDQLRLFANHQYKRAWFSEADIKANLEREYRP
jgi:acyl-homoserine lactone acylase PvdQ